MRDHGIFQKVFTALNRIIIWNISLCFQADAQLEMEHRDFIRAGLEYVCLIQEVQEKKKFEFVEIVSEETAYCDHSHTLIIWTMIYEVQGLISKYHLQLA